MKIFLCALLVFVTGCSGCVSLPQQKSAALRLEFEHGLCSGTAIESDDPRFRGTGTSDELITAAHCFAGTLGPLLKVNGVPVTSFSAHRQKGDSIRVHVKGVVFRSYAKRFGKARQGDRVTWLGNPLGLERMYREGYVAGIGPEGVFIDGNTCTGDSGSGVFNERGELIAVVSRIATTIERCSAMMLAEPV